MGLYLYMWSPQTTYEAKFGRNTIKKVLSILIAITMIMSLAACQGSEPTKDQAAAEEKKRDSHKNIEKKQWSEFIGILN